MSITADYHLHSEHSGDSTAPMETQILSGIEKGLKVMCFTDHYDPEFPYDNNPDVAPGTFELDYDLYKKDFLKMKDKYEGQIDLRFGVELGLQPHLGSFLQSYAREHDFDFIIGSNHLCAGFDPYYPDFLFDRTQEEALELYLEDTLANIRVFPDIDSCGHLDYVARYLPDRERIYNYGSFSDLIDPILKELITRGIAEISQIGSAMGGKPETFSGLTGIGDLIVTCASMHSRNRRAGILIGKGMTADEAMKEVKQVVEGVYSAKAALQLADKYDVEAPIIRTVNRVLFGNEAPRQAVEDLMVREGRVESSGLQWQ